MSVLIWIQTVCKCYRHMSKVCVPSIIFSRTDVWYMLEENTGALSLTLIRLTVSIAVSALFALSSTVSVRRKVVLDAVSKSITWVVVTIPVSALISKFSSSPTTIDIEDLTLVLMFY